MSFSRENPSPRYGELVALYQQVHVEGMPSRAIPAEKLYAGVSLLAHLPRIKNLVQASGARRLLDYGSGKGSYYRATQITLPGGEVIPSIATYLGVDSIDCYDPAVEEFNRLPTSRYDGVISTDALEHCPIEDMPWIVREMFHFSRMFVFANVASYPAGKTLPNGENAHATQQPAEWWKKLLGEIAQEFPAIGYRFEIRERENNSLMRLFRKRRNTVLSKPFSPTPASPSTAPWLQQAPQAKHGGVS